MAEPGAAPGFGYHHGRLCVDGVPLEAIAETFGTPCYVYSAALMCSRYRDFDSAFAGRPHRICFAVKANSNLAVLRLLAREGAGFDIVSVGELERVLTAGGDPARVVFAGVGKRVDEVERALAVGIHAFTVESAAELERIAAAAARAGRLARVALRVNPQVDASTHPYVATGGAGDKFGIPWDEAPGLARAAAADPRLELIGVGCHIGSQLTALDELGEAVAAVAGLARELMDEGIALTAIDVGGGLGIRYTDETPPSIAHYGEVIRRAVGSLPLELVLEPGRAIAGPAGVLLTRVEYVKHAPGRCFVIADAAMNDLMRPALYGARHRVLPLLDRGQTSGRRCDLVGPVCESGDFLARDVVLDATAGDRLAVMDTGAYGFVMSSNYNSRPRAAEVLVLDGEAHLVRERESLPALWAGEAIPAALAGG